ncbi:MAG: DUF4145 domain-containing protein, partial [Myxococcota bacterium]|nr:DUF4145 domain-containing protein [Myxococcota bacterium]
ERVYAVHQAGDIEEAREVLRAHEAINAIFVDPFGPGLDAASSFIFGLRAAFPDIVFVLYTDLTRAAAVSEVFYAGERHRFAHYFTLDKRTPMLVFQEEVFAVLRRFQTDLLWSMSDSRLAKLFESVQPTESTAVPTAHAPGSKPSPVDELFSVNLGSLKHRVLSGPLEPRFQEVSVQLIDVLTKIDRIGRIDPEAAIAKARAVTESMIGPLYVKYVGKDVRPLFDMIETLGSEGALPSKIHSLLHTVRIAGNLSIHYQPTELQQITPSDVSLIGMITAHIVEWYISSVL